MEEKNKKYIVGIFLISILIFLLGIDFLISVGILIVLLIVAMIKKIFVKRDTALVILLFFIFTFGYFFYYNPSVFIAKGQGTVLSDNWWHALNWIKNNTADCATIATYWDPGHFITGIARRPVVFDGASQGAYRVFEKENVTGELKIEKYDNGITQLVLEKDNKVIRARIKDIAISLMTSNESLAIDLLKDYRKPNCDELYFIASSDLIFKSVWWTYFATWDPARPDRGDKYTYMPIQLGSRKPLLFARVVGYEYPISERQSFVLYEENNTVKAVFQQDNQFVRVKKLIILRDQGYLTIEDPEAELAGVLLIPGFPSQMIFYIPEQLADSMFTRLYFFNGAGLKHFQFVNSWGAEVKLFKVVFTEAV